MLDIPKKEFVIENIYKKGNKEFLKNLYLYIIENFGEKELYIYFSSIYDDIFLDIVLKKVELDNEIKKSLELLAMPLFDKKNDEKIKIFKNIEKNLT